MAQHIEVQSLPKLIHVDAAGIDRRIFTITLILFFMVSVIAKSNSLTGGDLLIV